MSEPFDAAKAHDFLVRTMTPSEVELSLEWASSEGWNPGKHDARCFRAADPNDFFIRALRGEPVGCIAAVTYDERFGFIGLYLVKPKFRGVGFGMCIWRHGMAYPGNRNVVLDGVVAQQADYKKSGFRLAYRNVRFQGVVCSQLSVHVSSLSGLLFDQRVDCDQRFIPAHRPRFPGECLAMRTPSLQRSSSTRASRAMACCAHAGLITKSVHFSRTLSRSPRNCSGR